MKLKLTNKNLKNGLTVVKSLTVTEDTEVFDYMYMGENNIPILRVVLQNNNEIMVFENELPKTDSSQSIKNNVRND